MRSVEYIVLRRPHCTTHSLYSTFDLLLSPFYFLLLYIVQRALPHLNSLARSLGRPDGLVSCAAASGDVLSCLINLIPQEGSGLDTGQIEGWLRTQGLETGLAILKAGLIILLGVVLAKGLRRWLDALMERTRIREDLLLRSFFLRVLSVTIIILSSLTALQVLHFDVTSFVAGLGITGIILGFGFKDVLSNLAAGLLLLIYRPFRAGHVIEVEGTQGSVEELTIVNMQMTTTDGVRVIMPNSKVWGAKIVNYSLSRQRRLEFVLKVREDDVHAAIDALKGAMERDDRILKIPAPSIRVTGVADGSAKLEVWAWTEPPNYAAVSADEYLKLLSALNDADLPVQ
jgi:small conductance mechanosensitive channel